MIATLLAIVLALTVQQARDAAKPAGADGTISGRVVAGDGKTPLRRATVRLTSPALPRRLTVRADLQGRWSFERLPPGIYTVSAAKAGYLTLEYGQRRPFEPGRRVSVGAGDRVEGIDVVLPPSGSIAGVIVDEVGDPVNQMWVIAGRRAYRNGRPALVSAGLAVSDDEGFFRLGGLAPGEYVVVARQRDLHVGEFTDESLAFGTVAYPGSATVTGGQPIRIALGQHAGPLTFSITAERTARVSGRAIDGDGRPVSGTSIAVTDGPDILGLDSVIGGSQLRPDGTFDVAGLPPGTYALRMRHGNVEASADVDVRGSDVTGVTLVLGGGATVEGRVVAPEGTTPPLASMQLRAVPIGSGRALASPRINADATFSWTGLEGGRVLRVQGLPPSWWLKAITQGDMEITDQVFTFEHGQTLRDVRVVLDDRPTRLTGRVKNSVGAAIADYTAVVFSADESRWNAESRFIASARPDHTGAFTVERLPPGDYLAVAVDYVEEGRWLDRDWLSNLRRSATRVTLGHGDRASIELTLVLDGAG